MVAESIVTVEAKTDFNNGKGLDKKKGDTFPCDEFTANFLIKAGYVSKVKISHKDQTKK